MVLVFPVLLVGCLLLYLSGRFAPANTAFLVARVAIFLAAFVVWLWMLTELGGHFSRTTWRLLALVPATAGLAGLVGLDILRHRAARTSSHPT